MESLFTDKFRDPVALLVVLQQLRNDGVHTDEPAGDSLVDQWSFRAPAEWVGVAARALVHKPVALFQF